jgi:hypothetical protein
MQEPTPNNRSTGPRTEEGKQRSSQNAVKHGCCSSKLILSDENQSEFDQLHAGWHSDYEPNTQAATALLEEVIINHWLMLRAKRRYAQYDESLAGTDPAQWTEDQHKTLERMTRYRTSAERTFYRSFKVLESLNVRRIAEPQTSAQQETVDSRTTTTLDPINNEFLYQPQFVSQNHQNLPVRVHPSSSAAHKQTAKQVAG